jgi:hypothetical protein
MSQNPIFSPPYFQHLARQLSETRGGEVMILISRLRNEYSLCRLSDNLPILILESNRNKTRVSSFFLKFMQHIEIIDFFKTQHFT